jgi:hypothetical protein
MEKPMLFAVAVNGIIISDIQLEWVLAVELATIANEELLKNNKYKAVVHVITEYVL